MRVKIYQVIINKYVGFVKLFEIKYVLSIRKVLCVDKINFILKW